MPTEAVVILYTRGLRPIWSCVDKKLRARRTPLLDLPVKGWSLHNRAIFNHLRMTAQIIANPYNYRNALLGNVSIPKPKEVNTISRLVSNFKEV